MSCLCRRNVTLSEAGENLGEATLFGQGQFCGEDLKCTLSSQNSQWLGNQYLGPTWGSTWHTSVHLANSPFSLGWQRVPLNVLQIKKTGFPFSYLLCCGIRIYYWPCNVGLICYKTQTFFFWFEINNWYLKKYPFFEN